MDDSLSFESFLAGAKKAAHRAMDDHGRGEYDEFALHAGVAIERLAKAVLVSKNPIYIAEMKGSVEMLFHLGGHRPAGKIRTIGASEAIARLRMLDILPADRQLDLLIELRNGVAHTTSDDQAKSLLPTLAGTVETLHKELGGPLNAFWGRWTTPARLAVDRVRSQVYRDVQVRVSQARHAFEDRFTGLPPQAKELVLKAPFPSEGDSIGPMALDEDRTVVLHVAGTACPACSGKASVFYDMKASSPDAVLMVPSSFRCFLCSLELNTTEEIFASGARVKALTVPNQTGNIVIGETYAG